MNKKILLIGIASLVLLACSKPSVPPGRGAEVDPNPNGCSSVQLTLTLKTNSINLVPAQVKCVVANATFNMKIITPGNKVPIEVNSVTTAPKPDNPDWLNAANSSKKGELTIKVDEDAPVGDSFEYDIVITGHGELDPIVKVVGKAVYLKASEWDQKHYKVELLDLYEEVSRE
jgi:hypothetical protein